MTILNTRALGIALGEPLFHDLNLTISKGDRIGLVAANGRGKSTLLACLAGEIEPTSGDVTRARGTRCGHVRQSLPAQALASTLRDFVLAALPATEAEYESWRVDVVLDDLAVPHDLQHRLLGELSGGWQRVAMLAAAWITEPDLLLLDEPTNHLDLNRLGLLEKWLAALPADLPVVMTSHDRAFLDACTNRTLFLRPEASRGFALPYSRARAALDEADLADERQHANELARARQLRKQAAKLKNIGINSGADLLVNKTRQLAERADRIEAAARPAHVERSAGDIRLANSGTHARALIALEDAPVCTPDGALLYRTGQKWIEPGDRVVLLGANGTGKTRLIGLVAQAIGAGHPQVRVTPSLVAGHSDQHLDQLGDDHSPIRAITRISEIGDQRARAALAGAGIAIDRQTGPIASLSGGQKARLMMLILRLRNPNFYLMDEPTNHLDIDGQEALEQELVTRGAAALLVSHDRSFIRNVGNRFWLIDKRKLVEVDSPEPFLAQAMAGWKRADGL